MMKRVISVILLCIGIFGAGMCRATASELSKIPGLSAAGMTFAKTIYSRPGRQSLESALRTFRDYFYSNRCPADTYLIGVVYLRNSELGFSPIFNDEFQHYFPSTGSSDGIYDPTDELDLIADTDIYSGAVNNEITSLHPLVDEQLTWRQDFPEGHETDVSEYTGWVAKKYISDAAAKGVPGAMKELGLWYIHGTIYPPVNRDTKRGEELLCKAYEKGDMDAASYVGDIYFERKEYAKAIKPYTDALAAGTLFSYGPLGYCYEMGLGVPRDIHRAMDIYTSSPLARETTVKFSIPIEDTRVRIGILYYSDPEIKDFDKAFRYMKLVADHAHISLKQEKNVLGYIYRCLAACYRYGRGTAIDKTKAEEYTRLAANMGNADAKSALSILRIK